MIHVAILHARYLELIRRGAKTAELRLTKTRRAPFGQIAPGQRLYFKQSGGPFSLTAIAQSVLCKEDLLPQDIRDIHRLHNHEILGDDAYWTQRTQSRFLTLIHFKEVEEISYGPRMKPHHGVAWQVLRGHEDVYPACRVNGGKAVIAQPSRNEEVSDDSQILKFPIRRVLTQANIRNSHVYLRSAASLFPKKSLGGPTRSEAGQSILLEFDDGSSARTDLIAHAQRFRARAPWRKWFANRAAQPGDTVIIEKSAPTKFRVTLSPR